MRDEQAARGVMGSRGVLVGLLAAAIFIHALDRGNMATAAPLIKDDLRLSNLQIGMLISAFFWVYIPGHLLAAWMVNRINAYRTLALGLVIWSVATMLSGVATGFAMLLGLRLLLGLGESAGFPTSSKLLAAHVPAEQLGSANALITAGLGLGGGVGTLLGGLLIAHLGWHVLFFVFGGVSLLWLIPWMATTRSMAAGAMVETQRLAEPGFRELLGKRELWGASIGHFTFTYPYFLVLSWLPLYLVKAQGYSLTAMAELGGAVFALSAVFGLIAGKLADRWMSQGADSNLVRKTTMCVASVIALGCMLGCALGGPRVAVAGLLTFSLAWGLGSFNLFAIGQTLAGPRAAAKWMAVQNAIGGLAGLVGPIITGWIIDKSGSFRMAFLVAAGMIVVGVLCWMLVIRRVAPLTWAKPALAATGV